MDKLVTIKCNTIGAALSNPRNDVTFSLAVADDLNSAESGWAPVSEYVSRRAPLTEATLTSKIIQSTFFSSSLQESTGSLDILVPESRKAYRVTITGAVTNTVISGSIEGSI